MRTARPGCVFGGLTIALMGLLGRRVNGDRLGLAAAAVCAVYPLMIVVDGALMSETAYTPLVVLVLLVAWSALERPRLTLFAGLGALIGVAALVRSEALLLLPLLAWPVAWRGGSGWPLRALVASLTCAAALAPWTIRNAIEFGHLIPISINDSTVLRGANCDAVVLRGRTSASGASDCIPSRRCRQRGRPGGDPGAPTGCEYAREHAGRLAVVIPVRVLRTFSLYQPRRQVLFAEGRWIRGRAGRGGRASTCSRCSRSWARSRCGGAGCRCSSCSRRSRSCCSPWSSATAIHGCATCSSPR